MNPSVPHQVTPRRVLIITNIATVRPLSRMRVHMLHHIAFQCTPVITHGARKGLLTSMLFHVRHETLADGTPVITQSARILLVLACMGAYVPYKIALKAAAVIAHRAGERLLPTMNSHVLFQSRAKVALVAAHAT